MKKTGLALGMAALLFAPYSHAATTVDSLIEKLVDKGVLSKQEGIELKGEIASEEKLTREEGLKESLPKWVQNMKLKGDLRLRHQWERLESDTESRNRERIRYRLGVEAKVNDQVAVGAGLASGSNDPRSTNQTLENSFEHPDIRLDYAYGEYKPAGWLSMVGGKFLRSNYLWTPTDLLWDGDINPNGFSASLNHKLSENNSAFLNSGVWVIDENGKVDRPDPFLHYGQAGLKGKAGAFDATLAGIYYGFNGVKGILPDHTSNTNTLTGGVLKYDYDSVGASFEAGISNPFGSKLIERFGIFGDYIHNLEDQGAGGNDIDEDNGFAYGAVIGHKKVRNFGQWQFKYIYAKLRKDAFVDFTPDSDRLGGRTDIESHEAIFSVGLLKNVTFDIDFYNSRRLVGAVAPEKLVQTDLNFKF